MAITKVTAPESTPTAVADYEAQNNHILGFINQVNSQAFILTNPDNATKPEIAQGSYINFGGSLYIVDTGDESISGSPSDGIVYIKLSGTTTLSAEFITDISSYSWNQQYSYLSDGTNMILPYLIRKSGTSWSKYRLDFSTRPIYRMGQNVRTTDNVDFARVNTGHGYNELYAMNQNVRTTDAPTFATVNTGHGDNELYRQTFQMEEISQDTDLTITVDSMIVNEIKYLGCNFTNTDGDSFRNLKLYLPASGTYQIYASYLIYTSTAIYSKTYTGGTLLIDDDVSAGGSTHVIFIVRRVS